MRILNFHRDQKSLARTGERCKLPQLHRILRMEGSAGHSRCTCVDRPSRSHHEQFRTQGSSHVVCVFSSHLFWTSSSLDVPAGVTQKEGHTGFLIHLPFAVRALIFLARRIQPFLSLVDREAEFCVLTILSFSTCWEFFLVRRNPSYRDSNSRPHVSEGCEVTN